MFVVAGIVGLCGMTLVVVAALLWRGRVQPFPSSLRLSHAGVVGTSGLFAFLSAALLLLSDSGTGSGWVSPSWLRLLGGGAWLLVFVAFLWMFLQIPNQWASRMARAAEHRFDSR